MIESHMYGIHVPNTLLVPAHVCVALQEGQSRVQVTITVVTTVWSGAGM
jgi:hypothetical protein